MATVDQRVPEVLPGVQHTGEELAGLRRLRWPWLAAALGILAIAIVVGASIGPVAVPPSEILRSALARIPFVHEVSGISARDEAILWSLRMPRVVLAGLVGGMLALAGGAYQGVFRNPLADPYLLGAAAGAELGATIAIVVAPTSQFLGVQVVALAAFAGASIAVVGAFALGRSGRLGRNPTTLILAGVAVASFLTAIQTYVQQRQTGSMRQIYSWLLGRLVTAGWQGVWFVLPYVIVSTVVILLHRRLLDALAVGDEELGAMGVRVRRIRVVVLIAATLGTAAAVSVGGAIAFIGIIVPHTVRLVAGTTYRVVLPLSLVLGAAFLILADTVARTVIAPAELPIGVITALIGAPFFIVVMRTSREGAA
jgi:iron complex transport system permease protein